MLHIAAMRAQRMRREGSGWVGKGWEGSGMAGRVGLGRVWARPDAWLLDGHARSQHPSPVAPSHDPLRSSSSLTFAPLLATSLLLSSSSIYALSNTSHLALLSALFSIKGLLAASNKPTHSCSRRGPEEILARCHRMRK